MNIFLYIEFGIQVAAAIPVIYAEITTGTISGQGLYTIVSPILTTLQTFNSKIKIPTQLVLDICNAIADSVNNYYHPSANPLNGPAFSETLIKK